MTNMMHATIFKIGIYKAKYEESKCGTTYRTGRGGRLTPHDVLRVASASGQQ